MDTGTELHSLGFITADETARLLNLKNAGTVRNWRSAGKGPPYVRLNGRLIVYKRDDVLAWLNARRVVPEDEARPTMIHGTTRARHGTRHRRSARSTP